MAYCEGATVQEDEARVLFYLLVLNDSVLATGLSITIEVLVSVTATKHWDSHIEAAISGISLLHHTVPRTIAS